MNGEDGAALDATLERRLLNLEALRLGIDKTNAYAIASRSWTRLVFDSFVQKVIVPDNKMKEEEVKRYYDGHPRGTTPPRTC